MKLNTVLVFFFAFAVAKVSADTTYTTLGGPVNLVAGLNNLTANTAINTINQAVGIQAITDDSWSTAIFNLGGRVGAWSPTMALWQVLSAPAPISAEPTKLS